MAAVTVFLRNLEFMLMISIISNVGTFWFSKRPFMFSRILYIWNRVSKGLITLWRSPGAEPRIKPLSVSHRVNFKTVSTVLKEGHALQVKAAPLYIQIHYIWHFIVRNNRIRERSLLQSALRLLWDAVPHLQGLSALDLTKGLSTLWNPILYSK